MGSVQWVPGCKWVGRKEKPGVFSANLWDFTSLEGQVFSVHLSCFRCPLARTVGSDWMIDMKPPVKH